MVLWQESGKWLDRSDLAEYDIRHLGLLWDKMPRTCLTSSKTFVTALLAVALSVGFLCTFSAQAHRITVLGHPKITIWAWERDEDLSFIDPSKVRVAYFAGNVYVRGSSVRFRPRTQKLKLPKTASAFPVFRIESIRRANVSNQHGDSNETNNSTKKIEQEISNRPSSDAARFVAKSIAARTARLQEENLSDGMVQIDFDALEDERPFYKQVLKELRQELPAGTKISITSLASWLMADKWIERGSADQAVAMLFSIGPGKSEIFSFLKHKPLSTGAKIPLAIGISASEHATNKILFDASIQRKTDNLYIFSSRPWTESRLRSITCEAFGK